ncbi:hypothetical protein QIJ74_gp1, partial [ssRNA phage SRR5466727_3]
LLQDLAGFQRDQPTQRCLVPTHRFAERTHQVAALGREGPPF